MSSVVISSSGSTACCVTANCVGSLAGVTVDIAFCDGVGVFSGDKSDVTLGWLVSVILANMESFCFPAGVMLITTLSSFWLLADIEVDLRPTPRAERTNTISNTNPAQLIPSGVRSP